MEPLSSSDVFVVLLRQKLAERARMKGSDRKRTAEVGQPDDAAPACSISTRTAQAGADDRHLRRTIIEQLLNERLGSQFANESRFQQIVEQVTDLIVEDADLAAILADIMREVRR